jgi:translation initiation factor 3 subunit D
MHHAQGKGNVFTTDLALSVIMSAPRSVASWDIVMHRAGESIYLDVREGSAAFDTIVNETAQDAPEDEGKDGNMNRSAQEVKDALMNRSSLNNVNVLVAC